MTEPETASPGPLAPGARYPAVADHGVIGDLRTAALVAVDGTIDFLCLPAFDSPTVFAGLLDADGGGYFRIEPLFEVRRREQRYVRDTNVLVTRFVGDGAEVEVVDFMWLRGGHERDASVIVRQVRGVRGTTRLRCACAPRLDYARATHERALSGATALFSTADGNLLRLTSRGPLRAEGRDVVADVEVTPGKRIAFVLEWGVAGVAGDARPRDERWARRALRQTIVFWRRWIGKSKYTGEFRAAVRRSALALKLLQYQRSGAIVAAATFGLPEEIGGARNWDFRYSWIRDGSFTVHALGRIGLGAEARAFSEWVVARSTEARSPGELQSMYGIDGRHELTEGTLDHLEGYRCSRPVRIGNAAYDQLQLDIYGELLDALYQRDEHVEETSRALWASIVELTNWVSRNWQRPDQGIWEVRSGCHEFLYSRVMCWVAVDRALRIASRRRLPAPRDDWRAVRSAIHTDIHAHFWNDALSSFVGTRSGDTIDAACLVMPLVGFIAASDPRWQSTMRAVEARLVRDSLVRRYDMMGMDTDADRLTAPSFTICSFWYVECLARAGEKERAVAVMVRLLGAANHLGLFAENLSGSGQQTGNFPQGLVHSALIGAAIAVSA